MVAQDLLDAQLLLKQLSLPAKVELLRLIGNDELTLAEIIKKAKSDRGEIPAYRETVHRYLKEMAHTNLLIKEEDESGMIVYRRGLKGVTIDLVSITINLEK